MSHTKMESILQPENLLTVKEAMQELGISHATLYRWIEKNKLRAIKLGQGRTTFFYRDEIRALRSKLANSKQQLAM